MGPTSDKAWALKSGLMGRCTRDGGKITRPTVKEDSSMLTATSTMGTGRTIKLMDTAFTVIWMEPDMKATGKKTSNTVKA